MVDTYKELALEDYDTWSTTGQGKNKIKKTGANGTVTAVDEAENRAMYKLYLDTINAEKNKNIALKTAETNKNEALRENAIMAERAKEYVEKRAAMNGTSSAGVSQTAMIDLYSQMAGSRADVQSDYSNKENSIIQEYLSAIQNAQSTANETTTNAAIQRAAEKENEYEAKKAEEEATKLAEKEKYLTNAKLASEDTVSAKDGYGNFYKQNKEYDGSSAFNLSDIENKYENKLLRMAAAGNIADGTVIQNKKGKDVYYVYIDGVFYRIGKSDINNFNGITITLDDTFLK